MIVAGDYVGGTIFSLQSDGVYTLHIRADRATTNAEDVRLGGIWVYGLVGVPAGAIALLLTAPIVWKGRALKRLGCLSDAIAVLSDGLKIRGAADEKFRRAVV